MATTATTATSAGLEAVAGLAADELLTPGQAARVLGVSADRVRQLADAGRLAVALWPASGRLLRASEVAAFAAARRAQRSPAPAGTGTH